MNGRFLILFLFTLSLLCGGYTIDSFRSAKGKTIKITWVDEFVSDFSFHNNWSYPQGVYRNEFGQLSCNGFCPDRVERMKNKKGKILKDSLDAFYKLVDTTHLKHTIECDAWCYEWAGTNFIEVKRIDENEVQCYTLRNPATHCILQITIKGAECTPQIELISITAPGTHVYDCTGGHIMINRHLWAKGLMQAQFKFSFDHKEDPSKPMFWEGKIYTEIDLSDRK